LTRISDVLSGPAEGEIGSIKKNEPKPRGVPHEKTHGSYCEQENEPEGESGRGAGQKEAGSTISHVNLRVVCKIIGNGRAKDPLSLSSEKKGHRC